MIGEVEYVDLKVLVLQKWHFFDDEDINSTTQSRLYIKLIRGVDPIKTYSMQKSRVSTHFIILVVAKHC